MNEKLLRRLLRKIQQHGYYQHTDVALVDWFLSDTSAKDISEKYGVSTMALYQHKSRLARQGSQEVPA